MSKGDFVAALFGRLVLALVGAAVLVFFGKMAQSFSYQDEWRASTAAYQAWEQKDRARCVGVLLQFETAYAEHGLQRCEAFAGFENVKCRGEAATFARSAAESLKAARCPIHVPTDGALPSLLLIPHPGSLADFVDDRVRHRTPAELWLALFATAAGALLALQYTSAHVKEVASPRARNLIRGGWVGLAIAAGVFQLMRQDSWAVAGVSALVVAVAAALTLTLAVSLFHRGLALYRRAA